MKHTPTPWTVEDHEDEFLIFGPGLSERVALVDVSDRFGRDHAEANGAFIVLAVNAHEDLVFALRLLLDVTTEARWPLTAEQMVPMDQARKVLSRLSPDPQKQEGK